MRRLLKLLGAVIVLMVLLVIAAMIIVPLVVDPNDYKDQITGAVKDATGRTLTIDGKIGLSVFPWLGVKLSGVQLSNASGFDTQPFAAVQSAAVRVKLLPLLRKRVEVDKITLAGANLHLEKAADGRTNWEDLTAEPEAATATGRSEGSGPGLASLSVGGLELRGASVSWDDAAAGQHYALQRLNLETGSMEPGKPVDMRLSVRLHSDAPKLSGRLVLSGTLEASPDMQRFSVKPLDLRLEDVQAEQGVTGSGRLNADLSFDTASGRLESPVVDLKLDAKGGPVGAEGLHAELQGALSVATKSGGLSLKGLELAADDLRLTGDIETQGFASDHPSLAGSLRVAELDLRAWLQRRGIPLPAMADDEALTRFALEADLGSRDGSIGVPRLVLILDDSRLGGNLWMHNTKRPAFRFALDLDRLDLDRYLPPPRQAEEAPAVAQGAPAEAPLFPVDSLRALDLDGSLRIGELGVSGLKVGQVELKVSAHNGQLSVDQRVGKLYDGDAQGRLELNAKGAVPELTLSEQMRSVQASPLLKDLLGEDMLEGTGRLTADLRTRGDTLKALRGAMDGRAEFHFEDGAIKGVNLAKLIRDAQARLQGQPAPDSGEPLKTDFSVLEGQAVIKGDLVDNTALNMKSPLLRISGTGTADLAKAYLDYKTRITLVSSLEGQGGRAADELTGAPIPVHYRGPFNGLSSIGNWSVDLKDVALQKGKQKLKEKLKEKLFGGEAPAAPETGATGQTSPPASSRDQLKGLLKKGLGL